MGGVRRPLGTRRRKGTRCATARPARAALTTLRPQLRHLRPRPLLRPLDALCHSGGHTRQPQLTQPDRLPGARFGLLRSSTEIHRETWRSSFRTLRGKANQWHTARHSALRPTPLDHAAAHGVACRHGALPRSLDTLRHPQYTSRPPQPQLPGCSSPRSARGLVHATIESGLKTGDRVSVHNGVADRGATVALVGDVRRREPSRVLLDSASFECAFLDTLQSRVDTAPTPPSNEPR